MTLDKRFRLGPLWIRISIKPDFRVRCHLSEVYSAQVVCCSGWILTQDGVCWMLMNPMIALGATQVKGLGRFVLQNQRQRTPGRLVSSKLGE